MSQYRTFHLLSSRCYTAYQFYGRLRYQGRTVEECMSCAVLTLLYWISKKLGDDHCPAELKKMPPDAYAQYTLADFMPFHMNEGIELDITVLPEQGLWALGLKEPDTPGEGRSPVIGRSFRTDVSLHQMNDAVECAVCIQVMDPVYAEKELDFCYRPRFLHELLTMPGMTITQVEALEPETPASLDTAADVEYLDLLLQDANCMMPAIVLTAAPEDKLSLAGKLNAIFGVKPEGAWLDAAQLAQDVSGYARVYTAGGEAYAALRQRFGSELQPGCALWLEPDRFGGVRRVVHWQPGMKKQQLEQLTAELVLQARSYAKRKPYDFGGAVFETVARRMEIEERIRCHAGENGESAQIYEEAQQLLAEYDQELMQTRQERDELLGEMQRMKARMMHLEERAKRPERTGVTLQLPEGMAEWYEDEVYDLILSVLGAMKGSYRPEHSRAEELLTVLLEANPLTGEGRKIFARLKHVLDGCKNINQSDINALTQVGFQFEINGDGHYEVTFGSDAHKQRTFCIACSGSDVRGMKNTYSDIVKMLSVYK